MKYDFRTDPVLGLALAYWEQKCGPRRMPAKRDIDPVDMPRPIMPHLQIIEVLGGGECFKYKLIGTEISTTFGREYTGKQPEEILPPDRVQFINAIYRQVCEAREPLFSRNKYRDARGSELLIANRLYMPLSEDELSVNYIFAALTFGCASQWFHSPWGDAQLDGSLQYVRLAVQQASSVAQ